jgi:hypothetical protein
MAKVQEFYSINEVKKPPEKRVYHNNGRVLQAVTYRQVNVVVAMAVTGSATIVRD